MGQDTEHQEFAYGGEDRAIDDAHRRKQEASYDKQETNCKSQIEDFHNDSVGLGDSPREAFQVDSEGFRRFLRVSEGFRRILRVPWMLLRGYSGGYS